MAWETTEERSFTRGSILAALRTTIAEGKPVVGAGSSIGIVARSAEAGGADLIIVYSTGKTRIWGLPTTPLLHSNPVTLSMYDEIDNVVDHTPIIGGAHAGDPTYRRLPRLGARRGDPRLTRAGRRLDAAVTSALASGIATPDLGGEASTSEFAAAVVTRAAHPADV